MPRWRKIYLERDGFRMDNIHTKKQFLRLIRNSYEFMNIIYRRRHGDLPGVPVGRLRKEDIEGWMELLGATWVN